MKTLEGRNPSARRARIYTYIKDRAERRSGLGRSIVTNGAARRVAPEKGPDPKEITAALLVCKRNPETVWTR
jgi:hypothetical protein